MAEDRRRAMAKEERIADLVEVLEGIALDVAKPGPERIMAADKALDRLEGKPRQVQENQNRDMTLEKMVADAAKLRTRTPE